MRTVQYIFSINAGRSGSAYLAELLSCGTSVAAYHEHDPTLHGRVMRDFLRGRSQYLERCMREKLAAIHKGRGVAETYVDTSHVFIKSFGWLLPRHLDPRTLGIVVLERDASAIARSLGRIDCSPFRPAGKDWLITPYTATGQTPIPAGDRMGLWKFAAVDLLLKLNRRRIRRLFNVSGRWVKEITLSYEQELLRWYVAEVVALGAKFIETYPECPVWRTNLRLLNQMDHVMSMFDFFGIQTDKDVGAVLGRKVNEKDDPQEWTSLYADPGEGGESR